MREAVAVLVFFAILGATFEPEKFGEHVGKIVKAAIVVVNAP